MSNLIYRLMVKIIFVHPDLGIGGAERLIVDAALALQSKGHSVNILTSHHDKRHCFEETRDGTLSVTVFGDWLPRNVCGLGHAACAYVRMIYIALCLLFSSQFQPDVIICDLVSVPIPVFKLKTSKVIFYCHHPDQLLCAPGGAIKTVYRTFLNWLEEYTTRQASKIFVNSKYTRSVFLETFTTITTEPTILHPSLPTNKFDEHTTIPIEDLLGSQFSNSFIFLSLNRYERKKNVGLAINAFSHLQKRLSSAEFEKCHLVIAGGYDEYLTENVEHFEELQQIAKTLNLSDKVSFLKSPNETKKINLIKNSTCLLYTPSNEHFGIVPLEAMYLETPVIAVNSGGPLETIVDEYTGYLRKPNPEQFSEAIARFVKDKDLSKRLGAAGKMRVMSQFSFQKFSQQIHNAVISL